MISVLQLSAEGRGGERRGEERGGEETGKERGGEQRRGQDRGGEEKREKKGMGEAERRGVMTQRQTLRESRGGGRSLVSFSYQRSNN